MPNWTAYALIGCALLGSGCNSPADMKPSAAKAEADTLDATIDAVVGGADGPDAAGADEGAVDVDGPADADAGPIDVTDVSLPDALPDAVTPAGCPGVLAFASHFPAHIRRVLEAGDRGLIVAGNVPAPPGSGAGPLWLARLDQAGAVSWQHEYAGVTGQFVDLVEAPTAGFALLRRIGPGGGGANVVMTDPKGLELWSKDLSPVDTGVTAMRVTTGGAFALVGTLVSAGNAKGWVSRFDASGKLLAYSIHGEVIGWWGATAMAGDSLGAIGKIASGGEQIARIAADGTLTWNVPFDPGVEPAAVTSAPDDGLFIAGAKQDITTTTPPETFPQHIALTRMDGAGKVLWTTEFNVAKSSEMLVFGIAAAKDGGFRVSVSLADIGVQQLQVKGQLSAGVPVWRWLALGVTGAGTVVSAKEYYPGAGKGGQSAGIAALCDGGIAMVGDAQVALLPAWPGWVLRTDTGGNVPPGQDVVVTSLPVP